jgi:hypothetical protein
VWKTASTITSLMHPLLPANAENDDRVPVGRAGHPSSAMRSVEGEQWWEDDHDRGGLT